MPRRLAAGPAAAARRLGCLAAVLAGAADVAPEGRAALDAASTRRLTAAPEYAWLTPGQRVLWVAPGGLRRRYILVVPDGYSPEEPLDLWLAMPGTGDSPEGLISQSGMIDYAVKRNIAIAALEGQSLSFNVEAHAQPAADRPDDVEYTASVLRDVAGKLRVDRSRIYCVGFSRGARMCSRLASELSNFISAIAPVSGLRFPKPNNATRPMPIIAFHGTKDIINPFWGHGAGFWTESVPEALHKWVHFNGCTTKKRRNINTDVRLFMHTDCHDGADVFFVQVNGGGHTWPGSVKPTTLGFVSHDIDATVDIGNFFRHHRNWQTCKTATPGEKCHNHVAWAKSTGIFQHPEWFPGLTSNSTFEDFQAYFHYTFVGNCAEPCDPPTTTLTSSVTTATSTATQTTTVTSVTETTTSTSTSTFTSTSTTSSTHNPWSILGWSEQLESSTYLQVSRPPAPWYAQRGGLMVLAVTGFLAVLFVVAWKLRASPRAQRTTQVQQQSRQFEELPFEDAGARIEGLE